MRKMSAPNNPSAEDGPVNIDIDINEGGLDKGKAFSFTLPDDPIELTPLASDDVVS